jgi:mRNA deadenylase 3'-5' endonuclease subunit Ccr4
VFTGVPLVVEARSAHEYETIVAWFADEDVVCSNSVVYIPQLSDIGKSLSVLIIPTQPVARSHAPSLNSQVGAIQTEDGRSVEAYRFAQVVQALPEMPLISPLRDDWIATETNGGDGRRRKGVIRVMTYNILADLYTTRSAMEDDCKEIDQQQLQVQSFQFMYYNHCHPEFLSRKRRMQMILYELLVYRPDIICLQEVDLYVYDRLFEPCLRSQDYQGYYCNKASSQLEGCAAFWSLECFATAPAADMHCYPLRELFHEALNAAHDDDRSVRLMKQIMERNAELYTVACEKAGQIVQLIHLRPLNPYGNPNQPSSLIVANTHLFYHPLAAHVRALQAYILTWKVAQFRMNHLIDNSPVILCGDLNSHPLSGTIKLLLERSVNEDHFETWKHLYDYRWAMGDQDFLLEVRSS